MKTQSSIAGWLRWPGILILLIALLQFALHLWTNAHDNIFRDEMYYLVAAQHPAFSYVEYPPFVALVAGLSRAVLGDSVLAIRLLPAIAGVIIILLTASMAATLGGGVLAQVLAALPRRLRRCSWPSSGLLTMDPFDQLWWTLLAWVLMRMIRDQRPQRWLLAGAVIGIGLQTKLTIAFFVVALLAGLLLTPSRKLLFNRWLLFGGLIAAGDHLPVSHLAGCNMAFRSSNTRRNYSSGKTFQATPVEFLLQQVLTMNPLALPLWLGGLYFLFFVPAGKPYPGLWMGIPVPVRVLHAAKGQVLLALPGLSGAVRGRRIRPAALDREQAAGGAGCSQPTRQYWASPASCWCRSPYRSLRPKRSSASMRLRRRGRSQAGNH